MRAPGRRYGKLHDLVRQVRSVDSKPGQGNRKGKSPRPRASGIQIQNAIAQLGAGAMGVPRDNSREASGLRVDVERLEIVKDIQVQIFDLDDFSW